MKRIVFCLFVVVFPTLALSAEGAGLYFFDGKVEKKYRDAPRDELTPIVLQHVDATRKECSSARADDLWEKTRKARHLRLVLPAPRKRGGQGTPFSEVIIPLGPEGWKEIVLRHDGRQECRTDFPVRSAARLACHPALRLREESNYKKLCESFGIVP